MPEGLTMDREELDALAPLAAAADGRSSTRRLADVAKDVTGGPVPRMGGSQQYKALSFTLVDAEIETLEQATTAWRE